MVVVKVTDLGYSGLNAPYSIEIPKMWIVSYVADAHHPVTLEELQEQFSSKRDKDAIDLLIKDGLLHLEHKNV